MKILIHNYIKYNNWANERLTSWLKTLDPEILYKETAASFATIDLTLQHMKNAQNFWHTVIMEQDVEELDKTIGSKSFDKVVEELINGSQKMVSNYTAFSDQELVTKIASPVMIKSRYHFILHVVNHNSYHRGQIVTIARFLGVISSIPETDYEAFLWINQQDLNS